MWYKNIFLTKDYDGFWIDWFWVHEILVRAETYTKKVCLSPSFVLLQICIRSPVNFVSVLAETLTFEKTVVV